MKKKHILILTQALIVTGLIFAVGCKKKDHSPSDSGNSTSLSLTIEATDVIDIYNSSSDIVTAKVILYYYDDYDTHNEDVIVSVPYQNNGFKIELPANLDSKYLKSLSDIFENTDINVSDRSAKCYGYLEDIEGYDKYKDNIGWFSLNNGYHLIDWGWDEWNGSCITWLYVDKDVIIEGSDYNKYVYNYPDNSRCVDIIEEHFDLNCKKGWNVMYYSYSYSYNYSETTNTTTNTYIYRYTSQKPSGIDYNWYYYSYDHYKKSGNTNHRNRTFGNLQQRKICKLSGQ